MNETNDGMKPAVRGYKIINSDWTCRDKQYSCPGEFEEDVDLELCERGMHFCLKLSDCFRCYDEADNNHYVEVEAYGDILCECLKTFKDWKAFSGKSKCCTNKLRIIRELSIEEIVDILRKESKDYNFGYNNQGTLNYGSFNTGYRNEGTHNMGVINEGDDNIGKNNNGNYNIGIANRGWSNIGIGNNGTYCLGDFNVGEYSTGILCSDPSLKINLFNQPSDWTFYEWKSSDAKHLLEDIYTTAFSTYINNKKKSKIVDAYFEDSSVKTDNNNNNIIKYRQQCWNGLSDHEKQHIFDLPNFDADIFKECTGIDVNEKGRG